MAEVDTSSYPKLQNANPLQSVQQLQQIQSNALGLYKQNQEIQAKNALGPIMQGAIDPTTGELDYNKAFQHMAADPRTAWMAPDFLNQAIQRKAVQADTVLKELNANKERFGMFGKTAQQLLASGDAGDRGKVLKALADMHQMNPELFPKSMYTAAISQLPVTPGLQPGQQDKNLVKYLQGVQATGMTAAENLDRTSKIVMQDIGGQIVPMVENQTAGTVAPAGGVGAIGKSLTPEQQLGSDTTMVDTGVDALGNPRMKTKTELQREVNPAGQAAPGAGSQGSGSPPGSAPAQPSLGRMKEAGPLQKKELEDFNGLGTELQKGLSAANDIMNQVATGRAELQNFNPGSGQGFMKKMAEAANAMGVDKKLVDKLAGGSLSDAQAFESTMLQLATAMMKKALEGGGRFTNLEFSSFLDTKPNVKMTRDAIEKIFKGLEVGQKLAKLQVNGYNHYRELGKNGTTVLSPAGFQQAFQPTVEQIQKGLADGSLLK